MPPVHPNDDFNENELFNVRPNVPDASEEWQTPNPYAHGHTQPPRNLPMPPQRKAPVHNPAPVPMPPSVLPTNPNLPPHPHFEMPQHSVLSKYYRLPGPHIKLATKGVYLPRNAVQMTASGDLPVFPMRAADEMLLKSPDALMSGLALEKLFESCVPAIKAPRLISTPDIDVLLLGIRVATYGNTMSMSAPCKCGHENSFDCDLPSLLSTMKFTDPDGSVRLADDVIAYVRPYNLDNATKLALVAFEETRRLQAFDNDSMTGQQRASEVNTSMSRINQVNQEVLVDCVYKVVVEEGEVFDKREIYDFIMNIPKPWVDRLDAKIRALNDSGIEKKVHVSCEKCHEEWDTEVEFDPTNFFEDRSLV